MFFIIMIIISSSESQSQRCGRSPVCLLLTVNIRMLATLNFTGLNDGGVTKFSHSHPSVSTLNPDGELTLTLHNSSF